MVICKTFEKEIKQRFKRVPTVQSLQFILPIYNLFYLPYIQLPIYWKLMTPIQRVLSLPLLWI